jgi:hypothetical protein
MEILIGIVVVIVLMIVIGKMKGAPEPSSMSDAAIFQRLNSEGAWIAKYLSQPHSSQQTLKRMYEEKTQYIQSLKTELSKRRMAQGAQAANAELAPILQRTAELLKEGMSEAEATAQSLKEWSEKKT